jgi:hypothetical protein
MKMIKESPANQTQLVRVAQAVKAMLDDVLRHDFYGTAKIEVQIDGGTIQKIRRIVERIEK